MNKKALAFGFLFCVTATVWLTYIFLSINRPLPEVVFQTQGSPEYAYTPKTEVPLTATPIIVVLPYGGPTLTAVPAQQFENAGQSIVVQQQPQIITNVEVVPAVIEALPTATEFMPIVEGSLVTPFEFTPSEPIQTMMALTPVPTMATQEIPVELLTSMSLDDMWYTAVASGLTGRFSNCNGPLPKPFVTWDMAKRASKAQMSGREHPNIWMYASTISEIMSEGGGYFPNTGVIKTTEDASKGMLMKQYLDGNLHGCLIGGFPNAYGPGVQLFLNELQGLITDN